MGLCWYIADKRRWKEIVSNLLVHFDLVVGTYDELKHS